MKQLVVRIAQTTLAFACLLTLGLCQGKGPARTLVGTWSVDGTPANVLQEYRFKSDGTVRFRLKTTNGDEYRLPGSYVLKDDALTLRIPRLLVTANGQLAKETKKTTGNLKIRWISKDQLEMVFPKGKSLRLRRVTAQRSL